MVIIPSSYEDALQILDKDSVDIIAGGTDVMVKKRNISGLPPKFVRDVLNIYHLENLQYVHEDNNGLHIGSMTRLEDLLRHDCVFAPLKAAISEMASPAIRHVGTLGGNIGNASPAGDSLPILYAYDAQVVLASLNGERILPIKEFITGPSQTIRESNELIKEIILKNIEYKAFYYEKVGGRRSDAISKLSFVGMYNRNENGKITDIRIAFGAVYKTIVRDESLESLLIKQLNVEEIRHADKETLSHIVSIISDSKLDEIIKGYESVIVPIDEQRSYAKYRKACAISLLKSFVNMIGGE